jgi:hypothetical protein
MKNIIALFLVCLLTACATVGSLLPPRGLLYADFGTEGIWMWNGSAWNKITPSDPQNMVASGSFLYADFGTEGIWMWNGSAWNKITPSDPQNMVIPF